MEEVIKTFRLLDENHEQVGTEKWILKDGHILVYQKSSEGLNREWRAGSNAVKHTKKEEV